MMLMPTTMNPMTNQGTMFPTNGNSLFGAMAPMSQNLSTSQFGNGNGLNAEMVIQGQMNQMMMQMMEMMMQLMTSREQGGGSSFASPYASNYGDGGGSASPASSGSTGSSGSAGSTGSASTVTSPTASNVQNEVSKFAQSAEGKPYVYGAAGPNSFDCSGLSMQSWKQAGTTLPHNANAQYEALPKVPIAEAQVGDLVFFPGSDGNSTNPGHVGIVIDPAKHLMVSASTDGVALSKQIPVQNYMDEKGVYPTVGRPVAGKNYT